MGEYWRFDLTGGDLHIPMLRGDRLADGTWAPMRTAPDGGALRGGSRALGRYLCAEPRCVCIRDPRTVEQRSQRHLTGTNPPSVPSSPRRASAMPADGAARAGAQRSAAGCAAAAPGADPTDGSTPSRPAGRVSAWSATRLWGC